jgi:hypothetical protein|tara:strand:- start:3183 stop:3638 length:456 start_codon:yes stop_codon:yes gene_type:complete
MTKLNILLTIILLLAWVGLRANEYRQEKPVDDTVKKTITYLKDIPNNQFSNYARIQILDKIMAKSVNIDIKISEIYQFKTLSLLVHKCWQSKPEEKPENKALITVKEYKKFDSNQEDIIFNSWILSSSPSISSMEHVIYDVTLIKCFNDND